MNTSRSVIQDAINGFRVSQMISVVGTLRVADHLASGPKSVRTLAASTGAHEDALYRVLRTLAGLGIFAEQPADDSPVFRLTPAAEWLRSDVPGSLRAAAAVVREEWMWRPWGALLHSVMTGEMAFEHLYRQSPWAWFDEHPRAAALFNEHMEGITSAEARAIVEAFDFSAFRTIVDIAGGQGALLVAILRRHPAGRGILFNLASVIESASLTNESDVADRIQLTSGDFFEAVPADGDAYILKNILHDWTDERARTILATCRRDMPKRAALLVVEHLICAPNQSCYGKSADIQMMVRNGGRNRTEREFRDLLTASGFDLVRVVATAGGPSVLEARPLSEQFG